VASPQVVETQTTGPLGVPHFCGHGQRWPGCAVVPPTSCPTRHRRRDAGDGGGDPCRPSSTC